MAHRYWTGDIIEGLLNSHSLSSHASSIMVKGVRGGELSFQTAAE